MTLLPGLEEHAGATFDESRFYRYRLWRVWDDARPRLLWLMLNPSTADEVTLDPTIRRCVSYSKRWGFGGLEVANLFALRSTDPDLMKTFAGDPVGPMNDTEIVDAAVACGKLVICAWGRDGRHENRDRFVMQLLKDVGARLMCLGRNDDGTPKHPLYLRAALEAEPFD